MIYTNNQKTKKIYLGNTPIKNVYLGTRKVWQAIPPILYLWNEDTGGDNIAITGGWEATEGLVHSMSGGVINIPGYTPNHSSNEGQLHTVNAINCEGYTKLSIEYFGRNIRLDRGGNNGNLIAFERVHLPNSKTTPEGYLERTIITQDIDPKKPNNIGFLVMLYTSYNNTAFEARKIWLHN